MSEHEGFGVPLVESMWFDLPVMAYKSSAVPETLGEGGILFDDKSNLTELAFLASRLLHDKHLRRNLIAGQRSRKLDFHPQRVQQAVHSLVAELEQ
jgi:glycosyltransferase involved in cell wall biosynthesis